jgi:hypothetical protein
MDITESLSANTTKCCRLGGTLSKTSMCTHCHERELPFPGVRYRESDCELEDVDECAEGIDGCVLQTGGVSCANLDALASAGVLRFECVCAPGLFVSDSGCIAERFRTQFVLEMNHTEYPDAVLLIKKFTTEQLLSGVAPEMLVEEEERFENVGEIRVTLVAGSWQAMQSMTGQFDTTALVELLHALPRDADGTQSRFEDVDVARYGFNGNWLDSTGNGNTLQALGSGIGMEGRGYYTSFYNVPEGSKYLLVHNPGGWSGYLRRMFPIGTFSSQLLVSMWALPWTNSGLRSYIDVFFSFETPLMDGYIYLYHWQKGLYLRARASGHAECGTGRTPFFPYTPDSTGSRSTNSRFIEMTTQLEDKAAAFAGATAGLSTIRVSVDGQPILSVTGCMLDNALYTKLHIAAASGRNTGVWYNRLKMDDLWIRNKVPITQL